MKYTLNSDSILFAINRAEIVDIHARDVISVDGFPGADYIWTEHDGEFFENNPDDDVFLEIRRKGENQFEAVRIILREPHLQSR
jgi:hypothetical protein